ncbi:MAG: HAMP domain-containing histidine kinase [Rhizobiales bacterium]|nr:HAMP domain-containing histidine kinase [Hyphomicrobiales bacterium]
MRAIDKLSSSSSLRVGLLFACLMLLSAGFVGYVILSAPNEPPAAKGAATPFPVESILGWALIVFLVLSAIASLSIGYYVYSRINRIADTAGDIMASGNLGARLPIDSNWDDLSKLSVVLNRMLAEIEALIGSVQSVSDNIAHDLKSPLTRLKTRIDRIDDPALRASLREDVDGILGMFNALLRIAEVEADKQRSTFSELRLDKLLADAVDLYRPLADAKTIEIDADLGAATMSGDRDLLFQAISNVLDNAIKFSPEGSRVAVRSYDEADAAVVDIADSGIGIPDRDKPDATKRFFRVDESRSAPGFGLGLAMVAAIVKRHGGELTLSDAHDHTERPGLRCRLHFPTADEERESGVRMAPSSP